MQCGTGLWGSPALVSDLGLHHAQLGGGDVGASCAGQDGVQLLLLLLHRGLLGRLVVLRRRRRSASSPVLRLTVAVALPLPAGPPLIAVSIIIAVTVTVSGPVEGIDVQPLVLLVPRSFMFTR